MKIRIRNENFGKKNRVFLIRNNNFDKSNCNIQKIQFFSQQTQIFARYFQNQQKTFKFFHTTSHFLSTTPVDLQTDNNTNINDKNIGATNVELNEQNKLEKILQKPATSTPNDIIWAYTQMEEKNDPIPDTFLEHVILSFCKSGKINTAEKLYQKLKSTSIPHNKLNIIQRFTTHYTYVQNFEILEDYYNELLANEIPPPQTLFNSLLSHYCEKRFFEKIPKIYEEMKKCKIFEKMPLYIAQHSFAQIISTYEVHDIGDIVDKYFEEMREMKIKANVVIFNSLIHSQMRRKNLKKAEEYFNWMIVENVQPNLHIFTSMIAVCVRSQNFEKAEYYYQVMLKLGIFPNLYIFNTLIHSISDSIQIDQSNRSRNNKDNNKNNNKINIKKEEITVGGLIKIKSENNIEKIDNYYKMILQFNIVPNLILFSTILSVLAKLGNLSKAEYYLNQMNQFKIEKDESIYIAMIHNCHKNLNLKKAEKYYEELNEKKLKVSVVMIGMMIDLSAEEGDHEKAEKYMKEMIKWKYDFSPYIFSTLFKICLKTKNYEKLEKYYQEMLQNFQRNSQNFSPNLKCFSTLIAAAIKCDRFDQVDVYYSEMIKRGIKGDSIIYSMLLRSIRSKDDRDHFISEIDRILNKMIEYQIKFDQIILNTITEILLSSSDHQNYFLDMAEEYYRKLRVKPTSFSHHTLIKSLLKMGKNDQAEFYYKELLNMNIIPFKVTFECFIHFYIEKKNEEKVEFYYKEMIKMKLIPDKNLFLLIANFFKEINLPIKENEILILLSRYGLSFPPPPPLPSSPLPSSSPSSPPSSSPLSSSNRTFPSSTSS